MATSGGFWVVIGAREDIAKEVYAIVKKNMEKSLNKLVPEVPFKVKPVIRDTWGKIN